MQNSLITLVGQCPPLNSAKPLSTLLSLRNEGINIRFGIGFCFFLFSLLGLTHLELNFIWKYHFFQMDSGLFQVQELKG